METYFGNTVYTSSGSSWFYSWVDYEVTAYGATSCTVRYQYGVTAYGGWGNSKLQFDSWAQGASLGNTYVKKYPVQTDWYTAEVSYGSGLPLSCTAGYTGGSGTRYSSTASGTFYPVAPIQAPNAITGLSATRVSDSKNALSWTDNPADNKPYDSVRIERSVDGGSWNEAASLPGASTSWNDTATSKNHSYSYRARPCNSAGFGSYTSATSTLYNTPAAPKSLAVAVKSGSVVTLTVDNPALTASALEVQKSSDGTTWSAVETVSGSPVRTCDVDLGAGEFYVRARNVRDALASDWTATTGKSVTECPPGPPLLVRPASSSAVSSAISIIRFEWQHNPLDGSKQTAAEIAYRVQGAETWTTKTLNNTQNSSTPITNTFTAGSVLEWRARTKGSDPDWGEWSAVSTFYVRLPPQVSFEQPAPDSTVTGLPIHVKIGYIDDEYGFAAGDFVIEGAARGGEVYRRSIGSEAGLEFDLHASEWLPDNGESYVLKAQMRSTSTLRTDATCEIDVAFAEPQAATLAIEPNIADGTVSMLVGLEEDGEAAQATSVSVFRVYRGRRVSLAENVQPGAAVVDKYAPVNAPYYYEAVTFSESGTFHTAQIPYTFASPWFYIMRGNLTAKAMWDPSETVTFDRPEREYARYAGRTWPVMYDSGARSDTRKFSAVLVELSERDAWDELAAGGGECVYKSGDGYVFECGVDSVELQPSLRAQGYYGQVSATITRTGDGNL